MTRAVIAGIGQSALGRKLPHTSWELAITAASDAAADAGIDLDEIDGICRFVSPFENVTVPMMQRALGIPELRFFSEAPLGGEALGAVVGQAVSAVESGRASHVLIFRSISQSSDGRFGRADADVVDGEPRDIVAPELENASFSWPYGVMSPGHQFAMQATRYAHDAGISIDRLSEAMAAVAVTQRRYANGNPRAIMRDRTMSVDDYFASRMITWPLRLFDYCLENDGAVALIVSRQAEKHTRHSVRVLATSQSLTPYQEPLGFYQEDLGMPFPAAVAERLFNEARVTPAQIDVAALYDACSLMPIRSLEAYGFTQRGQGWRHVLEAGIGPTSPIPVNTHGGHLSEGYVHGMNGLLEAVRQLRGESTAQVVGADLALVGAPSGSAVILGGGS